MGKPKIAFIISSLNPGGAERVLSTLANEFVKNYDVLIINLYKDSIFYPLNENIKILFCQNNYKASKNFIDAIKNNYHLVKRIIFYLKLEKIELVVGFTTASNVLTVIAGSICRLPVIISERNNPYNIKVKLLWNVLRKMVYFNTSYLVLQTNYVKKYYKYFMPFKKIKILPNPISPVLASSRILNQKRKNVILNVGNFIDRKNQVMLIKAFSNINKTDWELHLIGDGKNKLQYQILIAELKIENNVKLFGECKDVYKYYNNSKIFAFSSKSEGFPNVLIEAMYFGLACVSVDCPAGPSELIKDGENGFLVPCNNQKMFELKLKELMESESLISKYSKQAIKSTLNFETQQVCEEWEKLIKSKLN